jgi:cytoskeleton protein RodZ
MGLTAVAAKTRIPSHILSAIENDDFSALPGGGYSRGVIRYFAREVGVDEADALSLFENTQQLPSQDPVKAAKKSPDTSRSRKSKVAKGAVGILMVLAVGIGGGLYFLQSSKPTEVVDQVSTPIEAETEISETPSPSPETTPEVLEVLVEAKSESVNIEYGIDGRETEVTTLMSGSTRDIVGNESVKIGFLGSNWNLINLTVAGRVINLPESQLKDLNRNYVVLTLKKEDLPRIVSEGNIDESKITLKRLRAVTQASPGTTPSNTPNSDDTRRNQEPGAQTTPISGNG